MPSGLLRLLLPDPARFTDDVLQRIYISGSDLIPWSARYRVVSDELIVEPSLGDSARLHVPWVVDGFGEVTISTGTLMQRDRPYNLLVELARGKINQIRNQLADWQTAGLAITPQVQNAVEQAMERFAHAATLQHQPTAAAEQAQRTLVAALQASEAVAGTYIDQALAVRRRQSGKLPTMLGARLTPEPLPGGVASAVSKAFNCAVVPMLWKDLEQSEGTYSWDVCDQQVQWCREQGLQVCGGPLLRLDERGLPDWLCLWEDDFEGLMAFASEYVGSVVQRYKGQMAFWEASARVNVGHVLSLTEEQKLRLAIRAVEVVRRVDSDTPVIIRFDQPWGEYLRRTDPDRLPVHFADDLVRAGVPLGGVGLELNVGYHPGGTFCRDRLDYSRMIDVWTYLGVPLYVYLTVPSSSEPDGAAQRELAMLDGAPDGWSPAAQVNWAARYVPLLLAKPFVQGVIWNQLRDAAPHEMPHGGLFDAHDQPKPTLTLLSGLRKEHLS